MTTRKGGRKEGRKRDRKTRKRGGTKHSNNTPTNTHKKETISAHKIQTFMKNPKVAERRTSRFLKNICSDSNVCIAFGVEQPKIFKFFDGYTNKAHIQLPIRSVGEHSKNGFINEITYERDGYISHAILKSSTKRGADNLVYEYIVGKYLNKMSKFFPCIMQTYSLVKYLDAESYHMLEFGDDIDKKDELDNIHFRPIAFDHPPEEILLDACKNPLLYAVLVQHIKDAPTFHDIQQRGTQQDITFLMHQIYFTLHCLRYTFTHYDLHMKNVLCYPVGKNKYVEFMYHMKDGTIISYNYHRLAYMIDYGRSFFHESDTHNSGVILDTLCKIPCPTPCGTGDGFRNLFGIPSVHITGSQRNISADLRLMKLAFDPSKKIYHKVKFQGPYSTPEVSTSGLPEDIHNVSDALAYLTKYLAKSNQDITRVYEKRGFTKIGTLHIHEDGITPIQYVPVPLAVSVSVSAARVPDKVDTELASMFATKASLSSRATAAAPPIPTASLMPTAATPLMPTAATSLKPAAPIMPTVQPNVPARVSTKVSSIKKTPYYSEYMNMYPRALKPRSHLPLDFYEQDTESA